MTTTTECAYLRFRVGQEWYGVPVLNVIEVLPMMALNEPPGDHVLGILTLRNMLVPVVDIRALFGVQLSPLQLDTPIVAVRHDQQIVGWLVDEADNVVIIPDAACIPYDAPYIHKAAHVNEQLVFLLQAEDLIKQVSH